ncbi:MAG: hypothetical protein ACXVZW_11665, partial [Gaiellaceae bacterium]
IYEALPMSPGLRRLVGRPTEEIHDQAVRDGMVSLHQDARRLVLAGVTTLDEVRRVVGDSG